MVEEATSSERRIRAVIFDLDNTLVEFVEAQIRACEAVISRVGEGSCEELIRYFLRGKHGFESHENIADYLKDRGVYSEKLFQECCEVYERVKLDSLWVYEGVRDVLEKLKRKYRLAVVTDAENGHAMSRLEKAGLKDYFDVIVSADMTGKRKPDPVPIIFALEKLGAKPEEAVIVGDSLRRDIEAGKKLGMVTIYSAYGDRNFAESGWSKELADFIAEKPEDILRILEKFG